MLSSFAFDRSVFFRAHSSLFVDGGLRIRPIPEHPALAWSVRSRPHGVLEEVVRVDATLESSKSIEVVVSENSPYRVLLS